MVEIQDLAEKMEGDIYTIVIAWRELSELLRIISLKQPMPPNSHLFLQSFKQHVSCPHLLLRHRAGLNIILVLRWWCRAHKFFSIKPQH